MSTPMYMLRRDVDRLFDDTFAALNGRSEALPWAPAADVREGEQEYLIELELPGVDPARVEVTADRGVLTVRGEKRTARTEQEKGRLHLIERTHGTFVRSFRLPQGFDEAAIRAEFEHGVLRVRLPKAALPQPRRIAISTGPAAVEAAGPTRVTDGQSPAHD